MCPAAHAPWPADITTHPGVAIPGGFGGEIKKSKLKEFQLCDLLNWRENGSHVEKAFNLGEPPLVPLSPYPPLISLIIPPKAGRLWPFLMNPLCPVSVHQDWQACCTKWAGNNQRTIRRCCSLVRDCAGEGRGKDASLMEPTEK